jgi:hypothetical protein
MQTPVPSKEWGTNVDVTQNKDGTTTLTVPNLVRLPRVEVPEPQNVFEALQWLREDRCYTEFHQERVEVRQSRLACFVFDLHLSMCFE